MKAKMVCIVAALALVFSMAAVIMPAGPAMADTIDVPGDYATIQAAMSGI